MTKHALSGICEPRRARTRHYCKKGPGRYAGRGRLTMNGSVVTAKVARRKYPDAIVGHGAIYTYAEHDQAMRLVLTGEVGNYLAALHVTVRDLRQLRNLQNLHKERMDKILDLRKERMDDKVL